MLFPRWKDIGDFVNTLVKFFRILCTTGYWNRRIFTELFLKGVGLWDSAGLCAYVDISHARPFNIQYLWLAWSVLILATNVILVIGWAKWCVNDADKIKLMKVPSVCTF